MLSTYVGRNGRECTVKGVLPRNPRNPNLNISLALSAQKHYSLKTRCAITTDKKYRSSSDNKPFVVKPVSDSIFGHLEEFRTEFNGNPRLCNHVDQIDMDKIVIYEIFKTDLRSLIEKYPPLQITAKKQC
jgi:hypothetical protein